MDLPFKCRVCKMYSQARWIDDHHDIPHALYEVMTYYLRVGDLG